LNDIDLLLCGASKSAAFHRFCALSVNHFNKLNAMYREKLMPVRRAGRERSARFGLRRSTVFPDLEARVHRKFPSVVKSVSRKLLLYSQSVCKWGEELTEDLIGLVRAYLK
jgi:hypothetical protein